jgi:hypothetical protein
MATDPKEGSEHAEGCPFCSMWSSWKKSEAAKHARGVERESLLLMKSMLQSCIKTLEGHQGGKSGG